MLSAGITALRRAETVRALAHSRLNRHSTLSIRWQSTGRDDGDTRDTPAAEPPSSGLNDPFAPILDAVEQARDAEQQPKIIVPEATFDPIEQRSFEARRHAETITTSQDRRPPFLREKPPKSYRSLRLDAAYDALSWAWRAVRLNLQQTFNNEGLPDDQIASSTDALVVALEAVERAQKAVDAYHQGLRGEKPEDEFDKLLDAAKEAGEAFRRAYGDVPKSQLALEHEPGTADAGPIGNNLSQSISTSPDFREYDLKFSRLKLPTDPEQLKALPTGFLDMTDAEQQEELWIVLAESRLGTEWKLPKLEKHRPYSHDYPPYSPSKVIGVLHRWRRRAWTPHQWRFARAIACNRSLRLPVLTAQAFLRRHTLLARRRGVALKIDQYLGGTREWKDRLAELENKTGLTEADIKQWLWILSPASGDAKFQRFFASKCRKPLFLLQLLLAKDKMIHEPATFLGLLQFMRENYVLVDRPRDELDHPAYESQGRSLTWWHYLVFLYRLVWHCREGWPAAMPLLARLTAEYISTMRLDTTARALTGYQARSMVLNKALWYFSWPARVRPMDHMEHNWAAQRHLLRLAATTEPPLVMDQNGYRAVRTVLTALSKTKGEARNADRAAKTWPPYRRTVDGIDERRDPEDDLSRSSKAGMLARAAGYEDDIVDRALSALGGSTFGQAPTIQTRSLPPPVFSGSRASHNIFSEWGAQVRATRNAREAWIVFDNPPEPGIRPTSEIYAQMFEKLFARPVTESPVIRPGDVKEVFPVHDTNLSEFEIARLTPPTPEELYDLMLLQDKLKPSGHCLVVLVRNARSKMAALRYLSDSPYEPHIDALRKPVSQMNADDLEELSNLPRAVFNAWIAMLCRLHTRAVRQEGVMTDAIQQPEGAAATAADESADGEQDRRAREVSQGGSIQEAIELTATFQRINPRVGHHDKSPWHTIMGALAGRKILYSRLGAEFNVVETITTFLKIFERTSAAKGVDPVSFEALCIMIRKALKLMTFQKSEGGKMVPRDTIAGSTVIEGLLVKAHRYAVRTFSVLTAPVPAELDGEQQPGPEGSAEQVDDDGVTPEMLRYNVVGRPLYRYMLALACCGDHNEMVRVMEWLLDGWDRAYIREEAKASYHLDYHYTMRTIAYFAEMGRTLVDPAEMERLQRRLEDMRAEGGCTWFWPSEGWLAEETHALPELETDVVLVERWTRLRRMVNFKNPEQVSVEELADLAPKLSLEFRDGEEGEYETELGKASARDFV